MRLAFGYTGKGTTNPAFPVHPPVFQEVSSLFLGSPSPVVHPPPRWEPPVPAQRGALLPEPGREALAMLCEDHPAGESGVQRAGLCPLGLRMSEKQAGKREDVLPC